MCHAMAMLPPSVLDNGVSTCARLALSTREAPTLDTSARNGMERDLSEARAMGKSALRCPPARSALSIARVRGTVYYSEWFTRICTGPVWQCSEDTRRGKGKRVKVVTNI